jgi:exopolysaccharide biosynthesis polyprenyl glycosylphosphotransferase
MSGRFTPTRPERTDGERRHHRGDRRRFARTATAAANAPALLLTDTRTVSSVRHRDAAYHVALLAADVLACLLLVGLNLSWLGSGGPGWSSLVVVVILPLVNGAGGLYRRDELLINKNTLEEVPNLLRSASVATVLVFLTESAVLTAPIGAMVVGLTWVGLVVLVPACRVIARGATRSRLSPERCLVVGDQAHGLRLASKLRSSHGVKAELVGVMPIAAAHPLGGLDRHREILTRLTDAVRERDVHRVVIAPDAGATDDVELDTIQVAKSLGVRVSVLPRVLEVVGSTASYDYVDGLTVLGVGHFGLSPRAAAIKRGFDILGSLVAVVGAGPLMAAIALAIRLSSPGPVFFRQARVGRAGEQFHMLKFRSMVDGADQRKDELRDRNEADGLFKIADDPRITRVGRFLRKTSLDELPQVFNVLRGEMSVVGPRPLVPDEDRRIEGWHRRRLHLTPGMTGPWQVLGSARIPLHEMVTIDYLYVANWSLWEDAKILLRTVGFVLGRRGR